MQIFPKFLLRISGNQNLKFVPNMVWTNHELGREAKFGHDMSVYDRNQSQIAVSFCRMLSKSFLIRKERWFLLDCEKRKEE